MYALKRTIPSLLGLLIIGHMAEAQFQVSNSNNANGNYPTFANAMVALTSVSQAGANATLTLGADITEAITLPAHDWASLTITPVGQRNISASVSTIATGLVNFDGAMHVTINGIDADHLAPHRLIINNPSTNPNANAIRFVNGASNNMVTNCTVRGAAATIAPADPGAVICFWLSGTTSGNSNNIISHCRIRNAHADPATFTSSSLLPARAIHSYPGSSPAVLNDPQRYSSGNRIEDNWIFNYFLSIPTSMAYPSGGVQLAPGNHQWIIRGNRFFQEAPREFDTGTGNRLHYIIGIDQMSVAGVGFAAGGHQIRDNVLGYGAADGTGSHFMTGSTNTFRAISMDVPNTAQRNTIANNVIDGIEHSTTAGSSNANAAVVLIYINSGSVDVDSNLIGNVTGDVVSLSITTQGAGHPYAIFNNSGTEFRTRGNRIGGITTGSGYFRAFHSISNTTWHCAHNEVGGKAGINGTMGGANPEMFGISATSGVLIADSNRVGKLFISRSGANTGPVIRGISATGGGPHVLTGNTIHDLSTFKSGNGGSITAATVTGIYASAALTATGNTIQRLAYYGNGTATSAPNDVPMNATVRGIWTNGSNAHLTARLNIIDSLHVDLPNVAAIGNMRNQAHGIRVEGVGVNPVIEYNRISRLRVHNGNSVTQPVVGNGHSDGDAGNGALIGINLVQGVNATVHGNMVFDLENTGDASLLVHATGMRVATTGTNTISSNLVHTIRASRGAEATALQSNATGIWLVEGVDNTVLNNMVRMGVDADGVQEDQGYRVRGLWVAVPVVTPTPQTRIWHNSVYVGGEGTVPTTQSSHALYAENNTVRDIRNNILWNARDIVTSEAGAHYALEVSHDTPSANLTSDYNCLRISGTNGTRYVVRSAGTVFSTLGGWQADTAWDLNSFIEDPNFADADGDVTSVDLRVVAPTPVDAVGVNIPQVTVDFDGEERALLTPVDIGAHAIDGTVSIPAIPVAVSSIVLWPNPTKAHLFVEVRNSGEQPHALDVHDASGRLVMTLTGLILQRGGSFTIPVQDLDAGAYMLRIIATQGEVLGFARFVKN